MVGVIVFLLLVVTIIIIVTAILQRKKVKEYNPSSRKGEENREMSEKNADIEDDDPSVTVIV